MRIYHVATLADWKQAQDTGAYTTSTYGRTLKEEGYIHAAYHDQVPTVRDQFYADVSEPLVVLEIETDRLDAEVREEPVGDTTHPHVYGAIPTDAVIAWRPARLPAIDLGTRRTPRPPLSSTTITFRGLALVLAAGALTAFVCAAIAQSSADDGDLPDGVAFLLWSVLAVLAVAALVALGYAEWARRQPVQRD